MKTCALYLTTILLFFCGKISAQTCCSAGAPLTSSFDVSSGEKGFIFHLSHEYKSVNLLIDNNQRLTNDPRTRNGQNTLFKIDFNLNENWAFSAFLPFVTQNRQTVSETEGAFGMGDLTLLSQYTLPTGNNTQIKFSTGIKLPTGNKNIIDDKGIVLSPDMQSGTGSYDFIGRIATTRQHLFIKNLTFQTALAYRLNGTNQHFGDPNGTGGRQFKFGNESTLTSTFTYLIFTKSWFIMPEIGLQLRHTAPNREQGVNSPNSGGFWVNAPLGLQFLPNQKLSIRLFGEIPITRQLQGLQITTDYAAGIHFSYKLNLKSKDIL